MIQVSEFKFSKLPALMAIKRTSFRIQFSKLPALIVIKRKIPPHIRKQINNVS